MLIFLITAGLYLPIILILMLPILDYPMDYSYLFSPYFAHLALILPYSLRLANLARPSISYKELQYLWYYRFQIIKF